MSSAGAPALAPGWTLAAMAAHSLDFCLPSADLPDPDNRVTLDGEGRIVLSYRPNNLEGHRRLIAKLEDLMRRQTACKEHGHDCHQGLFSRSLYLGQRIPLAGVAHQNGTVRFGADPETSALDADCRAHNSDDHKSDLPCHLPPVSRLNPAMTVMANALRSGRH